MEEADGDEMKPVHMVGLVKWKPLNKTQNDEILGIRIGDGKS